MVSKLRQLLSLFPRAPNGSAEDTPTKIDDTTNGANDQGGTQALVKAKAAEEVAPVATDEPEMDEKEMDEAPAGEKSGEEAEEEEAVAEAREEMEATVENEDVARTDESTEIQLEVAAKDPVAEETSAQLQSRQKIQRRTKFQAQEMLLPLEWKSGKQVRSLKDKQKSRRKRIPERLLK